MIRVNYMALAVGVSGTLLSIILFGSSYSIAIVLLYFLLTSITARFIKPDKKENLIPIIALNCGLGIYNILYIVLKYFSLIDLYSVDWRTEVQIILPILIGFIIRSIYVGAKKVQS